MSESFVDVANAALGALFEDSDGGFVDNTVGASDTGDTPDAAVDQPRGADGRFIPKEQEEAVAPDEPEVASVEEDSGEPEVSQESPDDAVEETVEDVEEAPIVLELDDDLLDLVENKYGGDLTKALRGLQEAQSLIGRQGTELGELRSLKEQIENLQQLVTLQQQGAAVDWEEMIAEDPQQAVIMAAQYQNVAAFEQAIEAWAAVEPIKAFTFLQSVQQEEAAPPPTSLEAEIDGLKARYPDLQQRLPAIQEQAEKRPALARLLNDQDPRTRAQALEDLYHLSGGAGTPDTSRAARQIILRAKADEDAAKADASVVSASNTAPPPAPPPNADRALEETLQQHLGLGDDFKIVG